MTAHAIYKRNNRADRKYPTNRDGEGIEMLVITEYPGRAEKRRLIRDARKRFARG